jgi:hypothetical protein
MMEQMGALDPLGIVTLAGVAVFLAATVCYQYRPWTNALSRVDPFHLLPRWTFFAPMPAMRDGHIVLRYAFADGRFSDWVNLDVTTGRGRLDPIWNPGKRGRKVVSDCINSIKLIRSEQKDDTVIKYYIPYLIILNLAVNASGRPATCTEIQFAIIETSGRSNRRIWVYFVSELHPFGRR